MSQPCLVPSPRVHITHPQYRGDYVNSWDGADAAVARGFNYHQGPEWVWPLGYYLRACLAFGAKTRADVVAALANHEAHLGASAWRGLPELTNAGGAPCADSCDTQAWSMSTLLDALYDAEAGR